PKILLALLTLTMMTGTATAQQRTFYDSSGKIIARSSIDSQGATTTYDARGKVISRESTTGNTTTVYDASGRGFAQAAVSQHRPPGWSRGRGVGQPRGQLAQAKGTSACASPCSSREPP